MGRQKNEGISLPNSDKRFKYIDLENELTTLLVSDSSIATRRLTAAACMTVNVGSSSDSEEALGLAHLLEHMVFLGSQKFPEENNLNSYLNRHGGLSNACTGMDHTSYVLKVEPQSLEGALERFSELFIAPLLKRDSMDREINAIDSEFELRKQYDGLRLDQIRLQTSTIDHSFVRFDCGEELHCCEKWMMLLVYKRLLEPDLASFELIGRGSFGDVYKAFDTDLNKEVAI